MQSTRCPSKALGQTIRCAAARTTLKLMSAQNNPASKQPHRLVFQHPMTGEQLDLLSPLPNDMEALIAH